MTRIDEIKKLEKRTESDQWLTARLYAEEYAERKAAATGRAPIQKNIAYEAGKSVRHVQYMVKIHGIWGELSSPERPTFYEAYNSDEVRGTSTPQPTPTPRPSDAADDDEEKQDGGDDEEDWSPEESPEDIEIRYVQELGKWASQTIALARLRKRVKKLHDSPLVSEYEQATQPAIETIFKR